jgi:hypothetical protein
VAREQTDNRWFWDIRSAMCINRIDPGKVLVPILFERISLGATVFVTGVISNRFIGDNVSRFLSY